MWLNRAALPGVWRRVLPMAVGLLPGVLAGTWLITSVSPERLKLATYVVLLPLILVQAAGYRRPIHAERSAGVRAETFRRVCMSFDAWVVSFGVATLLRAFHLVDGLAAFSVMAVVIAIDAWLLYRFFSRVPARVTITTDTQGGSARQSRE